MISKAFLKFWWMINLSIIIEVDSFFNNINSIQYWGLSLKNFDRLRININIDINQNNLIIKVL